MTNSIQKCRACGNKNLIEVVSLGEQALTGFFPGPNENVDTTDITLVQCSEKEGSFTWACGLVQLKESYSLEALYSDNYGYRSGLNNSMVKHLHNLVDDIMALQGRHLNAGDLVIDIASNDGTLLSRYLELQPDLRLVGIDPTIKKFGGYYKPGIEKVTEFFGTPKVTSLLGNQKAKIITSISMFYDLEDPISFCQEIREALDPVYGCWVFEQSYLPTMLERNSFDTIVLEHLEYYALKQVAYILDKAGLSIFKVEFNDCNGGSFRVYANHWLSSRFKPMDLSELLSKESYIFEKNSQAFKEFNSRVETQKSLLISFLEKCRENGEVVLGLGASTKGNSLLQYFNITPNLLPAIAEVNPDKFGKTTPGTCIPIISEAEAALKNPKYYLVLPWHFKNNIIQKMESFLDQGGHLVFPLPEFEIYKKP